MSSHSDDKLNSVSTSALSQVEEIYDLGRVPLVGDAGGKGKALGFIFLFKWIEERR